MTDGLRPALRATADLAWLSRLRWGLYVGAVLLSVVVSQAMHLALPGELFLVVVVGLTSNLILTLVVRRRAASTAAISAVLAADALLLTVGLYLTGGSRNPFSFVYLVPVVLAATLLGRRAGLLAAGLATVAVAVLAVVYLPLATDHEHQLPSAAHRHDESAAHHHGDVGHHAGHRHDDHRSAGHHHASLPPRPDEHVTMHAEGMWVVFAAVGALLVYLVSVALRQREAELGQREAELAAAEAARARNDQLAELGVLASTAAHELGSPLATIAVIAKELERRADEGRDAEDARAIRAEVARCRDVLEEMARVARREEAQLEAFSLVPRLEAARAASAAPSRVAMELDPDADVRVEGYPRATEHVLRGLIDNALEASPDEATVRVSLRETDTGVVVEVRDRGRGLSREEVAGAGLQPLGPRPGAGLGMGLFLGRALMERLGGSLELRSAEEGTCAVLSIPRGILAPSGKVT